MSDEKQSELKPMRGLFVVCDPAGNLVQTTVSLTAQEAIDEWLQQEASCNFVYNLGRSMRGESQRCRPSWEHFEAEGYKVVPVALVPEQA